MTLSRITKRYLSNRKPISPDLAFDDFNALQSLPFPGADDQYTGCNCCLGSSHWSIRRLKNQASH
jgi:hypothetical protein